MVKDGGPWVAVVLLMGAFVFALSRGIIMRASEIERIERRMEKDTDRVLALYSKQIEVLTAAAVRKDDTIDKQTAQIGKLIESSDTATRALDRIVKEAERRGFFQS